MPQSSGDNIETTNLLTLLPKRISLWEQLVGQRAKGLIAIGFKPKCFSLVANWASCKAAQIEYNVLCWQSEKEKKSDAEDVTVEI